MTELGKLFTKTNLVFFELLIDHSLSIRELAEMAHCSPAKASQAIEQFRKKDLVNLEQQKNKKMVCLNQKNALTQTIVLLLFIDKILSSKTFANVKKKAKSIGVYGSVVEGTMDRLSDIDLWVLSEKPFSLLELGEYKNHWSKELAREVSLKVLTPEKLKELSEKDKLFYQELLYKSRILCGERFD